MQFITITLLATLVGAFAAPATSTPNTAEPAIAVPLDMDNASSASKLFHCSGSTFVACAKAAGETAGYCGKAIAEEGRSITADAKCLKIIYEDYKHHAIAECKSCF